MAHDARVHVQVAKVLEPLMPNYLNNRHEEVVTLRQYSGSSDFDAIRRIGHQLRGSGSAYGLGELSTIGTRLESAAARADLSLLDIEISHLKDYLDALEITFAEPGEG